MVFKTGGAAAVGAMAGAQPAVSAGPATLALPQEGIGEVRSVPTVVGGHIVHNFGKVG